MRLARISMTPATWRVSSTLHPALPAALLADRPTPNVRSWRRDLLRAAPPRALRSGQEGAHQSFDNEDDLDKGLAQELDRLVNPQRAQKTANHLELMWKISGTRKRDKPQTCSCCRGSGEVECQWCHGTGERSRVSHVLHAGMPCIVL
mmetsp:Transcript_40074/g.119357  ORF Transcript_40074/g.119357 Transcript_40074/m.119357 type:complete len:148 (-) Transcript_40074:827-1270(-)